MFVLHELEKILQRFAGESKLRKSREQSRTLLAGLERVPVAQLGLAQKVRMQPLDIDKELIDLHNRRYQDMSQANRDDLSIDMLFSSLMKTILLDNIKALPARAYPSARLMICDHESHQLLMKFQFLAQQGRSGLGSNFIIYRQPYNVAAVFLLDDIVEHLNRLGRPFVRFDLDVASGRQIAQYDYSIIKQVFPYLKISDLVIVLHQIGDLKLRMYTMDGRREHQVLQFLSHFARSSMLLEMRSIDKKIGQHHLMFDNVTTFLPHNNQLFFDSMKTLEKQAAELDDATKQKFNYHLMPPLTHLTLIAYRLIRLVRELGWTLESITFRLADPNGFTKVFAHILDSVIRNDRQGGAQSRSLNGGSSSSIIPVRVLVLDRYFDFQGLLRHADRYGAFVEQELRSPTNNLLAARQLNALDSLDAQLCYQKLEEVLGALLKLSASTAQHPEAKSARTICNNQAIQKHLMIIKQMYKMMSGGHLLLRKLESSIESIIKRLRGLSLPLEESEQIDLVERIRRIDAAFRQLISVRGSAMKVSDAVRFACMLIDLINMLIYLQPNGQIRAQLLDMKISIVMGKELMGQLKSLIDKRGNDLANESSPPTRQDSDQTACTELRVRLDEFDKVASKNCPNRSALSLEAIVDQFYKRQLDAQSYPSRKLATSQASGLIRANFRNKIIVLTLGSMSYDELHRIKLLETKLTRAKYAPGKRSPRSGINLLSHELAKDILIIACGFIRPEEFIYSL